MADAQELCLLGRGTGCEYALELVDVDVEVGVVGGLAPDPETLLEGEVDCEGELLIRLVKFVTFSSLSWWVR